MSKPFIKLFEQEIETVARIEGMSMYEAATLWMEMACRSLHGGVLKMTHQDERWQQNEDRYMQAVKRLRKKCTSPNHMTRAMAWLTLAFEEKREDLLGPFFMEHAQNKDQGQFFTPPSVCRLMAEMTTPDLSELIEKNGYALMNEPACGAGAMVIETDEALRKRGVNTEQHVHWVMQDISWTAICCAYVQCSLLGVSAEILWMNTLAADEPWERLLTPMAVMFPKIKQVPEAPASVGYEGVINQMVQEAAE